MDKSKVAGFLQPTVYIVVVLTESHYVHWVYEVLCLHDLHIATDTDKFKDTVQYHMLLYSNNMQQLPVTH